MPTTTLYLVRHAKAADRETFTGRDRDRPLTDKGRQQAGWLAAALTGALGEGPLSLVAASPWLRCAQTAEAIAARAGLEVSLDPRLGYDEPDVAGWVAAVLERVEPGQRVVAVGHGDLLPEFLASAGLLRGWPAFRTGSLFEVVAADGRLGPVRYVDRAELRVLAGDR